MPASPATDLSGPSMSALHSGRPGAHDTSSSLIHEANESPSMNLIFYLRGGIDDLPHPSGFLWPLVSAENLRCSCRSRWQCQWPGTRRGPSSFRQRLQSESWARLPQLRDPLPVVYQSHQRNSTIAQGTEVWRAGFCGFID